MKHIQCTQIYIILFLKTKNLYYLKINNNKNQDQTHPELSQQNPIGMDKIMRMRTTLFYCDFKCNIKEKAH